MMVYDSTRRRAPRAGVAGVQCRGHVFHGLVKGEGGGGRVNREMSASLV